LSKKLQDKFSKRRAMCNAADPGVRIWCIPEIVVGGTLLVTGASAALSSINFLCCTRIESHKKDKTDESV